MILVNNQICNSAQFSETIFEDGLSLYEVIRVFEGHPIFLNDNILRLCNSIKKSNIDLDIRNLQLTDKVNRYIQLEHIQEGNIKYVLHITNDQIDEYIYQIPHHYPTEADYRSGVKTISCTAMRDNPEIKYINNSLRTLADRLIREHQVYEIILKDEEGYVTEGSRSNIFFIKDNILYTAPTTYVLPGTGRKRVLDICKKNRIKLVEERISYATLAEYDAAFITGTSPLVLPIHTIDDFSFEVNNSCLREIMAIYFSLLR